MAARAAQADCENRCEPAPTVAGWLLMPVQRHREGTSALSFVGWPPTGTRSAEVRDVEVELERADLWVGLIQEDQPRWDISVGRVIRRQIEGALQGPVIEGHRQAVTHQRVGVVD